MTKTVGIYLEKRYPLNLPAPLQRNHGAAYQRSLSEHSVFMEREEKKKLDPLMSPAPDGLALDKRPLPNESHPRQIPSSSAFVISRTGFFPLAITRLEKIKSTRSLFSLLPPPSPRAKQVKSNRLDGGRRVSSAGVRAAGRQRRGPRGREEGREREALGERVGGAGRG